MNSNMDDEGQGQDGPGTQCPQGKGLGYYAPLVCERVEARRVTTYNDVSHSPHTHTQWFSFIGGGRDKTLFPWLNNNDACFILVNG
jgi:hypothetical protein